MNICVWCNEKFEKQEAECFFEGEILGLVYRNIRKCLCGKCSVEAIEDEVDGVYFETCEVCGVEFDLIEESAEFSKHFTDYSGTVLRDYWNPNIVCCDCALRQVSEEEMA